MLEWNKIHQGDNLAYLKQLVDDQTQFDLICTDPPYNIGKDFGNDTDCQSLDEFLHGLDERINLMQKLLVPNGSIILFCTHRYLVEVGGLMKKYFSQRRLNIWFYENGMSRQEKEPVTEFEPFWWFSQSQDNWIYNLDDVRVPYKTDRVRNPVYKVDAQGNKRAWTPDPRGRKRGDVWQYPTLAGKHFENEKTAHPTQKPLPLITDIIKAFGPKGTDGKWDCRILDPYMGSGTLAACCERLNRSGKHRIKWMGFELNPEWVAIGTSRVEEERRKRIAVDIFADES